MIPFGSPLLDPFKDSAESDYEKLLEVFGIQPLAPILSSFPIHHKYLDIGLAFGHRDIEPILKAMKENRSFAVMTGIKPSNRYHMGSKKIADAAIYFQRRGAFTFYCIADIEAYEVNGIIPDDSKQTAIDNVADLLALGLDPEQAFVYRQSKCSPVHDLAFRLAGRVPMSLMTAIYGQRPFGCYLASLVQAADILFPQIEEFGGPRPTVVPVGADQDPSIRLARDLSMRFHGQFRFVKPSALIFKLTRSLGQSKMSKSKSETCLFLSEDLEAAKNKIRDSITGGQPTTQEQRSLGGNPNSCPVYETMIYIPKTTTQDLLALRDQCRSGRILCGECKELCADLMEDFLNKHQEQKAKHLSLAQHIVEEETYG